MLTDSECNDRVLSFLRRFLTYTYMECVKRGLPFTKDNLTEIGDLFLFRSGNNLIRRLDPFLVSELEPLCIEKHISPLCFFGKIAGFSDYVMYDLLVSYGNECCDSSSTQDFRLFLNTVLRGQGQDLGRFMICEAGCEDLKLSQLRQIFL